jgi:hypothetical protein
LSSLPPCTTSQPQCKSPSLIFKILTRIISLEYIAATPVTLLTHANQFDNRYWQQLLQYSSSALSCWTNCML